MTSNPQPLVIKEAIGDMIKLSDVPMDGATAQILPYRLDEFEGVLFYVQVVLDGVPLARLEGITPYLQTIEINVPRAELLNHVGPKGVEFSYLLNIGGNQESVPNTKYVITH
jgi:hypothetical protein